MSWLFLTILSAEGGERFERESSDLRWGFSWKMDGAREWVDRSDYQQASQVSSKVRQALHDNNKRSQQEWVQCLELLVQLVRHEEGEAAAHYRELGNRLTSALLADWTDDALPVVSVRGGEDPDNHRLKLIVLASAARYYFRGNEEDFALTRKILLQYAEHMHHWPLSLTRGENARWVSASNTRVYQQWGSGGIWGRWYHLDLKDSFPLLLAYDLIYSTLDAQDRERIEKGIFHYQVEVLKRYPYPDFRNLLPYQLEGLAQYGRVTGNGDWVHEAVSLMHDLCHIGFYPDGMWREVTPAYHRQVRGNLRTVMNILNGYSDPTGYVHSDTGERMDDLDLRNQLADHWARMDNAMDKITLPDGMLVALNDADPKYQQQDPKQSTHSSLLGASGVASLGSGEGDAQQQWVLNFSGTHGHEHHDMLHLSWYALGRRLFDETRYRPLPGSESTRAWHMATAAHNTVVIDGRNQLGRFDGPRRAFGPDDSIRGYIDYQSRETLGGTRHQGDILLMDGQGEEVQVMEVEGRNAYGKLADLYRRTLVKVSLPDGGYMVDIFRVKGGEIHDFMLHGALEEPYRAEVSVETETVDFILHEHIRVSQTARPQAPWKLDFVYKDGVMSRSLVLAPREAGFFLGDAPAINRQGVAPFAAIRGEGGETVFVVVHEAVKETPSIVSARLFMEPTEALGVVGVEVELRDGRLDRILAGEPATPVQVPVEAGRTLDFDGRLAWLREQNGRVEEARLWEGTLLRDNETVLVRATRSVIEGEVMGTLRREDGEDWDALVVAGTGFTNQVRIGQAVHVNLGEMIWSYVVKGIREYPSRGVSVVQVEHDPGFRVEPDGLVKMLFFPGWGSRQTPVFRIPLKGEYQTGHPVSDE